MPNGSDSRFPVCSICDKPLKLETSKTDELGKAVHEGCYLLRVSLKKPTTPAKEYFPTVHN
jgi:hypothetical protein